MLSTCLSSAAQTSKFCAVSYNVENLFDTCHDAGFDDYEFLPTSERRWDTRRYRTKLARIARVITAVGGESPAELVALCEVENDSVVRDLTERTRLARLGYRFVMTHSNDPRGIDVALLYQPARFRLLSDTAYTVPVSPTTGHPTRDLLHVTGLLPTLDTLDVFVCHLPSRLGHNTRYRTAVARRLRTVADSVMHSRRRGFSLMMGDFNDEYRDASIARGIGAVAAASLDASTANLETLEENSGASSTIYKKTNRKAKPDAQWVVLSADLKTGDGIRGTYKYRGQWNELDQIIVSRSLLTPASSPHCTASSLHCTASSLHCTATSCRIFAPAFLLEQDTARGGVKPHRTFLGPVYHGGFSDHLPLVVDFELH